ncbi:MAG: 50S ribosomal protein L6 [Candidatus Woesearchaeota archaeon]
MKNEINAEIEIPENIDISVEKDVVKVEGPNGSVERKLASPKIEIKVDGKKIMMDVKNASKREKTLIGTFKAHINNMLKGVESGHEYKLKICSSHFPMNVSVNNGELIIKNYLGENNPRKVKIKSGVDVKVDGTEITVKSIDVELAGQVAADIESATRITNRDRRIFQDGIFIIEKRGKKI